MAWRWIWVLGFALIAPAALPAGGADWRTPELRRRQNGDPLLAEGSRDGVLRASPHHRAPCLLPLPAGAPLRLLRVWQQPDGERWLHVEAAAAAGAARRGWLVG